MTIFVGPNGVRAGWRFAGYVLLLAAFIIGFGFLGQLIVPFLHIDVATLNAPAMFVGELITFAAVVLATFIAASLEKRRIDSYGLPVRLAFGSQFWEGIALGVASAALVAIAMYLAGGFKIQGFGLHGADWIVQPAMWGATMLLVGITEEYWFRGYLLQSLVRGVGFWPAAIITTLIFAGLHLTKPDENVIDIANIFALGILTCLMLRRTGSLWLAVGFHAAYDFMQFFVIGTRNGGAAPVGTLFSASFPGPAWVNGGPLGTEASYFMLPVIAVLFVYVLIRHRNDVALIV